MTRHYHWFFARFTGAADTIEDLGSDGLVFEMRDRCKAPAR